MVLIFQWLDIPFDIKFFSNWRQGLHFCLRIRCFCWQFLNQLNATRPEHNLNKNQLVKLLKELTITKKLSSIIKNVHAYSIPVKLTMLLTPHSGRTSSAAIMNSFPYFATNCFRTSMISGMSAHLEDANITLEMASFNSTGQFLKIKHNWLQTAGK